ncbi:tyrosine recombinase XerS [Paenibacillus polymyxa]|uniref:tyrosine recombinase XerS n=1 Tax=Paenibacillus polymyxa TaxID=1406 RepID=UPI00021BBA9E|nr:tyrosine recombinase XerS [Paenibacillus polymyxa]MDN4106107.1 tyrosine recombinase XerS [Paenibacillus polymyxa]CCC86426.1 tyrosine recombinase xerS [Paenibacillus polymyxa M1]
MHIDERKKLLKRTESKLIQLPWYVKEFIEYSKRKRSPNTLLNYTLDYITFFDWLISEGFYKGERVDIPIEVLESLRFSDIDRFGDFLSFEHNNAPESVDRKYAALKSLFHYLSQISEDEHNFPYLKRNVMIKVQSSNNEKSTLEDKAARIENKILLDDEIFDFRLFVAEGFKETIKDNRRILNSHLKNMERDLALISLILGSGMRISETIALDLNDIDRLKSKLSVTRKGNKKDSVTISDIALQDLTSYLQIRESRYHVTEQQTAVFLSLPTGPSGKTNRLTVRAAQKMMERYAKAFGKPGLSMHKLRHTFATKYNKENNNLGALKEQLGHTDVNVTMIYTHIGNEDRRKSVNKADS